jgi:hypothetical protein
MPADAPAESSLTDRVRDFILAHPMASITETTRATGAARSMVSAVRAELVATGLREKGAGGRGPGRNTKTGRPAISEGDADDAALQPGAPQVKGGADPGEALRDGPLLDDAAMARIEKAIAAGCTNEEIFERFGTVHPKKLGEMRRRAVAARKPALDESVKKKPVTAAAPTVHAWESPAPENVRAAALALLATFDKAAGPDRAREQAMAARALRKLLEANPAAGTEAVAVDADLQRDYDEARAHNRELAAQVEQLEADVARIREINAKAIETVSAAGDLEQHAADLEKDLAGVQKELGITHREIETAGSFPRAVRAWRERGTEMQIAAVAAARAAARGRARVEQPVAAVDADELRLANLGLVHLAFQVTHLQRELAAARNTKRRKNR